MIVIKLPMNGYCKCDYTQDHLKVLDLSTSTLKSET
jgi:hypothetical protein